MIQYNRSYLGIASGLFIIFILTCSMIKIGFPAFLDLEDTITNITQQLVGVPKMNYTTSFINSCMTFFTTYGDATTIVILTLFISIILFLKHYTFLGFWFLGVVSTGGIVGVFLKHLIQRERPINHLPLDNGFSFPSGHSIGSSLFFGVLLFVLFPHIKNQILKLIAMSLSSVIWFGILSSRIYFSAHHLGDIIAGVSFGLFWVSSAMIFYSCTASWFQKFIFKKGYI